MSSTVSVTSRHEIIVECAGCGVPWNRTRNSSRGRNRVCDVCELYFCRDCSGNLEKCEVCRKVYCNECSAMVRHHGKKKCFRCQPEDLYFGPNSPLCGRCGSRDRGVRVECISCRRTLKCDCLFVTCEFCGAVVCRSCPGDNFCRRCGRNGKFACTTCCTRHGSSSSRHGSSSSRHRR